MAVGEPAKQREAAMSARGVNRDLRPDRKSGERFDSSVDIRSQLERILASNDFKVPGRNRKFLSYVVEETLAGRADRIKAYSIAIEAFGRDASFDPQSDPVVRIEAGHVRRALERYYLTGGQLDPLLISIPIGGYIPTFTKRDCGPKPTSRQPIEADINGVTLRFGPDIAAGMMAAVIKAVMSATTRH
jgi:hypothetical protein